MPTIAKRTKAPPAKSRRPSAAAPARPGRNGAARARPITDLRADPSNPRRIDDAALAGLSASERRFGDLSGIVHNHRSGHLVAGHQRVRALRDAGAAEWTPGPGPHGDGGFVTDPRTGERFAVRVVDWDATTERAANIVANSP